uniref:NADH-ubiquinone oxidoreductase chain 6 n=1 Tax=Staphylinidae sp. BMNH 1274248 TaxID=1796571 RepID=A0A126TET9_9COLE|nr:NADH dehydrogenase subunit 6 [Staphylinidae sp. BMNH 1274248]
MTTMMLINLTLSILFMFLNHPMTMGLILLLQTISVSLITGNLMLNFWFSYIIFLIMVGGMLVLFIYMTSIASNEMFNFSKNLIIIIMMMIIFMNLFLLIDPFFFTLTQSLIESVNYNNKFNYNLSKFFNYPSMIIIFMMITYLFITLIAVVKITKIEYGPLRQFT